MRPPHQATDAIDRDPLRDAPRDRRAAPRRGCDHRFKARCGVSGRYLAGRCVNLSEGGALLVLDDAAALNAGQRIDVGLVTPDSALIAASSLRSAVVVRSLGIRDRTHIAIQ